MKRIVISLSLALLVAGLAGCGGDSKSDKQPKLSGEADPRIKGPVSPTGGPGAGKTQQKAAID